MNERPFSPACERNRRPILGVLRELWPRPARILEIGSGTGQHAAYFCTELPHLQWQASDRAENLPGIRAWLGTLPAAVPAPIELDVEREWPDEAVDGVFSANTAHIMSWSAVEAMFAGCARLLPAGGAFALYGPFNLDGHFTSDSNRRFDEELRGRDPRMGLRDLAALDDLAEARGLRRERVVALPANNMIVVWRRQASAPPA